MIGPIREIPAVQKAVAQFDQLPRRDQQALTVMAIALLVGVLYFAVWRPVTAFHTEALADHEQARSLVSWMESNRNAIEQLAENRPSARNASQISDSRALMSAVTSSAGEAGIKLQRFEPSGENAIRLWLEDVPFNSVAAWLEQLTDEYGIVIDQAALDRADKPGMISARLTLQI
ncbi:type II secretion system protein GspM [Marinobacter sp.]|uniref:type II secretion system protein GspM n=1 Tax=Marinobacter sp. TaxID=50741 RepID=UPI00384FD51F